MILSHEHRFIFLKTKKTASSSIEIYLSQFCGPEDVITPARPDLELQRPVKAQNWRLDPAVVKPKRSFWRRLLRRPERYYSPSVGYYEHMPSALVRDYVGEAVWKSYYKFSFERNPWDRQISYYFYKIRNGKRHPSFARTLDNKRKWYVDNYDIYSLDGEVALDFVGRYENLEEDFRRVLREIGLPSDAALPHANKTKQSQADTYRRHYDDRSKAIVAEWYSREIDKFGYEF